MFQFNNFLVCDSFAYEANLKVQELLCQKIDWDQEIPKDLDTKIEKWKSQLCLLDNITILRFHYFTNFSEIEICIFADASNLAYKAVATYRIISNYNTEVSFIIKKSQFAPLNEKCVIIPKLELQATVVASKLKVKILEQSHQFMLYLFLDQMKNCVEVYLQ